ncbi:APC family permease [Metallosphaera hakonensis]|uniref:Amino acid permease n=1 Tax=Metallosphaera hakonensis JCM 8857 = DSM 7519 TaxID=1293036 RepID=A0A2U9IW03_9CREN|nr:APC family permease [Metallosphaera hakonensis]AWS00261.1 amino acid permease [Metallosphaera hakonensis JCM 8857 = DSM 7519]
MSKGSQEQRNEEPKRVIGVLDLIFLSLGGQSPFLSVLTYGVEAYLIIGTGASLAIILGTVLVLINGMVVYILSRKFTKAGGYYTYAYYSLTKRLGFETGWLYLLYSSMYGSAYVLGASYILSTIIPVPAIVIAAIILGVSSAFAILGIKPTAKYAIVASLIEITMMTALAVLFMASTRFYLYNPIPPHLNLSELTLAILFGSSIPTGYGSIAPLSGEVKNPEKSVPRAIITVILLGGLLAAFDVYGITDHLIYFHITANQLNLVQLIDDRFGLLTLVFVLFAAANDGILATLTYMMATSRTVFAMSRGGFLPQVLGKLESGKGPLNAVFITVSVFALITIGGILVAGLNAFLAFTITGLVSLLANIFVHLASDFSLLKISLAKISSRVKWLILSLGGITFSSYELLKSIGSSSPIIVYFFMGTIILGFLAAEIMEMSKDEEEDNHAGRKENNVNSNKVSLKEKKESVT